MNLLGKLGIRHSVLYDNDAGNSKPKHKKLAELISRSKNKHTSKIETISPDIEGYLEVKKVEQHAKPQHLLFQYHQGAIDRDKLNDFISVVNDLVSGSNWKKQWKDRISRFKRSRLKASRNQERGTYLPAKATTASSRRWKRWRAFRRA